MESKKKARRSKKIKIKSKTLPIKEYVIKKRIEENLNYWCYITEGSFGEKVFIQHQGGLMSIPG